MKHKAVLIEQSTLGLAWSGHKVNFCLFTTGSQQYVGYYDENRQLTIAARVPGSDKWKYRRLDIAVEWDSHNTVEMFCDSGGHLHIAANMHKSPLTYYRMERAHDLASIVRIPAMTGRDEAECTYPRWLTDFQGRLIFHYRTGRSGAGDEIYNVYDAQTGCWSRLLDQPLTYGGSAMNAYFFGPQSGPDGYFHLGWVWRDTNCCETNHNLSYARSRDLVHWEDAAGRPLILPMTLDTPGLIVVPTGRSNSGLINMGNRIGFDADGRPVLSFHLYGSDGASRIGNARLRADGTWQTTLCGDWPPEQRWEFSGWGSIRQMVFFSPVRPNPDGTLEQGWEFIGRGTGRWRLDPDTLEVIETLPALPEYPPELQTPEQDFPGLVVHFLPDAAGGDTDPERNFLRWETLPANRDLPREGALPEPTRLTVCRVKRT